MKYEKVDEMEESLEDLRQRWVAEQREIAKQVGVLPDDDEHCAIQQYNLPSTTRGYCYAGGLDVSFPAVECDPAVAVYVVLKLTVNSDKKSVAPTMQLIYQDYEFFELSVPYIPTFLAFREKDPLELLLTRQRQTNPAFTPDLLLVDGNGVWHPRRAGLACFVGLASQLPTIGIGKSFFMNKTIDGDDSVRDTTRTGHWTKDAVSVALDRALEQASQHIAMEGKNEAFSKSISKPTTSTVFDKTTDYWIRTVPNDVEDSSLYSNSKTTPMEHYNRSALLEALPRSCRGVALVLDDAPTQSQCAALVGHGGCRRLLSTTTNNTLRGGEVEVVDSSTITKTAVGTKNPIYISVGHGLSLCEAIGWTALWSASHIPEPIRQADLRGRALLRDRNKHRQEQQQQQKQ